MLLLGREDGLTFGFKTAFLQSNIYFTQAQRNHLNCSRQMLMFLMDSHSLTFIWFYFLLKYTLTEILPTLHFKLDPLQSTKVARSNHHIRNWPTVNWPIVEPLAVNTQSAKSRGVICVYFSHTVHVVTFFFVFFFQTKWSLLLLIPVIKHSWKAAHTLMSRLMRMAVVISCV